MITILLADDHTMFREGLKQILARYPDLAVAAEAGSGDEVLALLETLVPDVVVLDISMPGRSGLDVLRDLVRLHPEVPVLILSMHPEEQYALRVLRSGAAGYLTKESAAEELVTAIRKVASGNRYVGASLAERLANAFVEHRPDEPHDALSDREYHVFRLIASGRPLKAIGEELHISEKTVTTYRARVLEKLGLRNNAELVRYAVTRGLAD